MVLVLVVVWRLGREEHYNQFKHLSGCRDLCFHGGKSDCCMIAVLYFILGGLVVVLVALAGLLLWWW